MESNQSLDGIKVIDCSQILAGPFCSMLLADHGADVIKKRINKHIKNGIVGVNIGPNKETKDQKNDFCLAFKSFLDIADYITINISSPNTEGLRDFHDQAKLKDLLSSLNYIKKDEKKNLPLLIKVSPDISDSSIPEIVRVATENDVSAIILTNTTNGHRDKLINEKKIEKGGLSGEPIQKISTRKASEKVLNILIPEIPELIGGSADLTPSNNTKINPMSELNRRNYGGRYVHYGIREHGMASIMNGLSLHKGVIPYGGTFLIFSDYCS